MRVNVFADFKYKFKQRIGVWNILVQFFIFQDPVHQDALALQCDLKNDFDVLVLLKDVSFSRFERDRFALSSALILFLATLAFPSTI